MNIKGITSGPDSLIRQILLMVRTKRPFIPIEDETPAKFMFTGLNAYHAHRSPE